jgi:serine/threonine protein kinase
MAPELKGHFRSSHSISVYSISVDIWAIGVITMELLLTHPFLYSSDQEDYTRGIKPLRFDEPPGMNISKPCQDFIKLLLIPNPIHRPTAEAAISHSWFANVGLLLERENLCVSIDCLCTPSDANQDKGSLLKMKSFHPNALILPHLHLCHYYLGRPLETCGLQTVLIVQTVLVVQEAAGAHTALAVHRARRVQLVL